MIAIIGAGLTGLSTAYHLSDLPYSVFDSEKEVGGLCRSVSQNGFVFDYTGHLLHMKDPYTKNFIETILPNTFLEKSRKASVFLKNCYLPYPFQANLHGLPKKVVLECLFDFAKKRISSKNKDDLNFKEWVIETFGKGISEKFFIPYNEKLFRTGLENLTKNWASWSIPRPSLTEVIRGALGIKNINMGYNASFYYPAKSGIDVLPKELEKRVKSIQLNKKLVSVDISNKCIEFNDGTKQNYNYLVSTLPLPNLLKKIEGVPDSFRDISKNLNYVSVQNLNIGLNRKKITDFHWIYFPEKKYPFYRVGCYSNISNALAPENTSSLYIEISSRPEKKKIY
jgi:protoporphyrinogen oxidase